MPAPALTLGPAKWIDPHAVTLPADRPAPTPALLAQMEASFRDFGQLTAVLLTPQGALLAGQARTLTARATGRQLLAREVDGAPEALEALRREEDFVRMVRLGHLDAALHTHAMDVWYADRGERAGRGRSSGLTVADLAVRRGVDKSTAERHLRIGRSLSPAARDVLVVQPDASSWSLAALSRFVALEPETQDQLAARIGDETFDDLLDAAAPRPEKPGTAPEDAQVARLVAFVEAAEGLGGPWTAWGAEAADLLARIEASLGGGAAPVPASAETPSAPAGVEEDAPETTLAADPPATTVDAEERAEAVPADRGRRPADVVREALPDVAEALAAGQAALDRARRTGHRPAATTVTLESEAARVAAVVAPALGVVADGASVTGPGDAVDVARVLAEALAPRMRGEAH